MSDHLQALRHAFNGTDVTTTEPELAARHLSDARKALANATGQLALVTHTTPLTSAQAKQLAACSASLRRAAQQLETLATGVEDHLQHGVSLWVGEAGAEQPVLL